MKTIKNTIQIALIVIMSIAISTSANAQMSPYKFNQLFNQAFGMVVEGNHSEALPILERLYQADSGHGQVAYIYGICRMKTNAKNHNLTRNVLQSASRKFDYNHQYGNANDRTAPVNVWFHLAEANAHENRLDKAIESYRNYMSCIQMASLDHKRMVKDRIEDLKQQKVAMAEDGRTIILAKN